MKYIAVCCKLHASVQKRLILILSYLILSIKIQVSPQATPYQNIAGNRIMLGRVAYLCTGSGLWHLLVKRSDLQDYDYSESQLAIY